MKKRAAIIPPNSVLFSGNTKTRLELLKKWDNDLASSGVKMADHRNEWNTEGDQSRNSVFSQTNSVLKSIQDSTKKLVIKQKAINSSKGTRFTPNQ